MLLEIFLIFFKIGAFTFGGGFAMLPIIKKEISDKRGWIEEEKFLDAIAVAQSSPGPVAVNLSIYTGYELAGFKGAVVATLGTVLPSFLIILVVARFLYQYRNNPVLDRIFMGVTPGIVGLIAAAVYGLIKSSKFERYKLLISLGGFLIIVLLGVSPIYVILVAAAASIIKNSLEEKRQK